MRNVCIVVIFYFVTLFFENAWDPAGFLAHCTPWLNRILAGQEWRANVNPI